MGEYGYYFSDEEAKRRTKKMADFIKHNKRRDNESATTFLRRMNKEIIEG